MGPMEQVPKMRGYDRCDTDYVNVKTCLFRSEMGGGKIVILYRNFRVTVVKGIGGRHK